MLVTVTIDSERDDAQQPTLGAALTPEQLERLKELISKPREDAGGASAATAPQTKIRVNEEDYTLQVSYDGGEHWEIIQLGNVIIDQIHGTQIRDIAPIVTDMPVTRDEYGELQDRVNAIAGVDNLLSMIESIQFTPYPDLSSIPDEEHSNALAEQEMANRLPKSFVNQLLRLFNESIGKTDRDPDILTRIYDLEKKVKSLENK